MTRLTPPFHLCLLFFMKSLEFQDSSVCIALRQWSPTFPALGTSARGSSGSSRVVVVVGGEDGCVQAARMRSPTACANGVSPTTCATQFPIGVGEPCLTQQHLHIYLLYYYTDILSWSLLEIRNVLSFTSYVRMCEHLLQKQCHPDPTKRTVAE